MTGRDILSSVENDPATIGEIIVDGVLIRPLGLRNETTHFKKHDVYGDWTLDGKEYYLNLLELLPVLNEKTGYHRVPLSDIAWKGFDLDMSLRADNCICCMGNRFRESDPLRPGILLEGISNPGGRKYRCIDGKHRIEALLSYEQTLGTFYILNMDHIKCHLNHYYKE